MEAGGSEVEDESQVRRGFKASLRCIRSCLKSKQQQNFFFFTATSFLQMENGDFELKVTFSLEAQLIINSKLGF